MIIRHIESKIEWDNFINAVSPHTFLQSWQWGEFNERMGNKIWRLGIFEDKILEGIALILKIEARRGSFLFCPHGPVVSNFNFFESFFKYLTALGKQEKVSFIRISPLFQTTPKNSQIFKNLRFNDAPVHMMHPERSWILDITPPEEIILKNMRKQTRHCIRNAKDIGVEISISSDPADVAKFYALYKATVSKQGFTPFSFKYLEEEFMTFSRENLALLFFGKYHNQVISTAIIIFSRNSAFYHHGASDSKFSKIPASHMLQWEVIREAKRRGLRYYNFWGIAPENIVNHPWAGLTLYKRGFGGFSEDYLHAQDLILNYRYYINFVVEKIRRLKRNY